MNFKEQMQGQAKIYVAPYFDKSQQSAYSLGHINGSRAALTSDLVKGLAEAVEDFFIGLVDLSSIPSGSCVRIEYPVEMLIKFRTALTNYKQEVNNLKQ